MSIINKMSKTKKRGFIPGKCANCAEAVYESLFLLDDAYNVWVGVCPHCGAGNCLSLHTLRGYSSQEMHLVLPTDEEVESNDWPKEWPTSGAGGPPTLHGTQLGELSHKLRNPCPPH